jgi:hypothetical protein
MQGVTCDRQPNRFRSRLAISELSLMTRVALGRELAPKVFPETSFHQERYFRGVTTVTCSPQSTCNREKTSSTLDVFGSARLLSLPMYF